LDYLKKLLEPHRDLKCALEEDDLFEVPSILEDLITGLEPHGRRHLFEALLLVLS